MNKGWARFAHRFSEYYRNAELWNPPRIRSREWMFIPFGGGTPSRHKSFNDIASLRDHLVNYSPHSVFYSTAYWKKPYEFNMSDKQWLGSDLIFDLDGDHLPGVVDRDFPAMLEVIKEQAWKLWTEFLVDDFGFKEEYAQFTFSGHRGYHIHYRDPALLHLEGDARRELVSHIRGEGVDVNNLLTRYDDVNASGWTSRIRQGVNSAIEKMEAIAGGDVALLNETYHTLRDMRQREGHKSGVGKPSIKELALSLQDDSRKNRVLTGRFESLGIKNQKIFLDLLKADSSVVLGSAGETDEVVTIDVKRQIRWPGSLHGKCGLRVCEISPSDLDPDNKQAFDPLSDGVALSRERTYPVEVIVEDARVRFDEDTYEISAGQQLELHEAAATFLILKGWARLNTPTAPNV